MNPVVIDTNCLLQIIARNSPYRPVWDAFLKGNYDLCVSNEILEEYQEVIGIHATPEIAENIVLDKMDQFTKLGFVNWNKVRETARTYMDMVGLDFDPMTPVMKLSAAHKQLIQIAKALSAVAESGLLR